YSSALSRTAAVLHTVVPAARGPPGSDECRSLAGAFPALPCGRSLVVVAIERVSTSCGYAVPLMDLVDERDRLIDWAEKKGEAIPDYWAAKNAHSIDGLPGL